VFFIGFLGVVLVDRDSFPTLVEGVSGWPVLRVPFGSGGPLEVEYNEGGNEYEDTVVIRTGGRPVRVFVDDSEVVVAP
jgi:hypothetical protein